MHLLAVIGSNKFFELHGKKPKCMFYTKTQVDWGFPVGATASVSFIGAFRFLGVDKPLNPNFQIHRLLALCLHCKRTFS